MSSLPEASRSSRIKIPRPHPETKQTLSSREAPGWAARISGHPTSHPPAGPGAEQPLLQASDPAPASGTLTRSPRACTHRSPLPWLYTPARISDLGGGTCPCLWAPLSVATLLLSGLPRRPPPPCPAQGCAHGGCFPPRLGELQGTNHTHFLLTRGGNRGRGFP